MSSKDRPGARRRALTLPLVFSLLTAAAVAQTVREEVSRSERDLVIEGALVTLTGRGIVPEGRLWIRGGRIQGIFETEAAFLSSGASAVERLRTEAWVFPGFINLHTHLPFNHEPLWVAGRKFDNRYQWQVDPDYLRAVMMPHQILFDAWEYNLRDEQTLFGEVRALVGGTTALLSTREPGLYTTPGRLVRNLEHEPSPSGQIEAHVAEIDDGFVRERAPEIRASMARGELRAFVAHLAEGVDRRSREELARLKRAGLLRKETVVVHGTGLEREQLVELGAASGHLVWAPTSNLLLYGSTADVKTAMASGVTVSLSNDWAPSGTPNLLAELKVADAAYRARYGESLAPKELVEMITTHPARAIGWEKRAGHLGEGAEADLVLVARLSADPYRDLLSATEEDVELVLVHGEPLFGRADWMERLKPGDSELLAFDKRLDVTWLPGDSTLARARARLREALRFDEERMLESFLDPSGRPRTRDELARHLSETYPGLTPQPLAPLFLAEDDDFFERLRAMDFPFTAVLEETYRRSGRPR